MTLVSVVMPAHNAEATIEEAIASVLDQTWSHWELIITDDGSTDGTFAAGSRFRDPRIRWIRQDRRGVSAARNRALAEARGELLALLDADDRYLAHKLERQVALLAAEPGVGATYAAYRRVDQQGIPWTVRVPPATVGIAELIRGFPINPVTFMVRRQWHEKAGEFREDLSENEDRHYWLRLAAAGCRFERTDGVLADYRMRPAGRRADRTSLLPQWLAVIAEFAHLDPEAAARGRFLAHQEYALRTAACGEPDTARRLFQSLLELQPDLPSNPVCRDEFLQAVVDHVLRSRAAPEPVLDAIFTSFDGDLASLATERRWASASALTQWAVREITWHRHAEAAPLLQAAAAAGARLDERTARLIRYHCAQFREAYGEGRWRILQADLSAGLAPVATLRQVKRLLAPLERPRGKAQRKLRVAFLLNRFPEISETFILNQITGLIDRGHDVKIFVRGPATAVRQHPGVARYRLSAIDLHQDRIGDSERLPLLTRTAASLLRHAPRQPRLLARVGPLARYGGIRDAIGGTFPIGALLDHGPFDIVHAHYGPNGEWAVELRQAGAFNAPIVTTFHSGSDPSVYPNQHDPLAFPQVFQHGDLILGISDRMTGLLAALGAPGEKLAVHRVGVDLDALRGAHGSPGGSVNILSTARLVEMKGIAFGLRAVARLAARFPDIRYRIAGDGPLRPDLDALIAELGIGAHVDLMGWREADEVRALLKEADVFLAPSITSSKGEQEGLPTSIMEALAARVPVVATGYSGTPELVRDGVDGYLTPERDVDAIAAALCRLIEMGPEGRSAMGAIGRQRVAELHDIEKWNDLLVERYRELIRGAAR